MGLSHLKKPSNGTRKERVLTLSLGFYLNDALVAPQHCHILRLSINHFMLKRYGHKEQNLR